MKLKQNGFTLVETLLVVLILAVLGFAGYTVWRSHHKVVLSTAPQANKTTRMSTYESDGYLTISQWGVRMKVPSSVNDIFYTYKSDKDAGFGWGVADLSSVSLRKLFPNCNFGSIIRMKGSDLYDPNGPDPSMTVADAAKLYNWIKPLGGYYYDERIDAGVYCTGPNSPKQGGVPVMSDEERADRSAMADAFNTLEQI